MSKISFEGIGETVATFEHTTLCKQSRVPKRAPLWKPQTTKQAVCCPLREHTAVCCQQPVSRSVFALCKVWRFKFYGILKGEKYIDAL